mmetsp:Transcript_2797/g.6129  ORF Transcript_2797/g.6129 Transcript_2797/m.6129 type:complete len:471 (-) Transcript_2797:146-1558(-)
MVQSSRSCCTACLGVVLRCGDGVSAAEGLIPHRVEPALCISPLVGVAAKEVALGLDQVGRQAGTAVGVKVSKGGGDAGDGHAGRDGLPCHAPPGRLALGQLLREEGVDQEVGEGGVALVGLADVVQEAGADNAAALPDPGQSSQVDVPVLLLALGLDDVHALGVAADLGGVQRLAHVVHQLGLVDTGDGGGLLQTQLAKHLRCGHTLALECTHVAAVQGGGDGGGGHGQVSGLLDGPLACSLAAGLVHDLVDQEAGPLVILLAQDDGGDLHQEALQLPLVPLGEGGSQLLVGEAAQGLEDVVGLRDELHVAILNAVVHHLDVVAGTSITNVHDARPVIHLCSHLLHDGLDVLVGLSSATRHQGGAPPGSLLAARHTHAHVQQALLCHLGLALLCVLIPLVAAVNNNITRFHILLKLIDGLIYGSTGLDENDDSPGPLERCNEVLDIFIASQFLAKAFFLSPLDCSLCLVI